MSKVKAAVGDPSQASAEDYVRRGFALVRVQRGMKRPTQEEWQLEANAARTVEDCIRFRGSNIGLAHRWSGTCAVDIDDFQAGEAWFTQHGVSVVELLTADDAVQITSGRENRAKLLYRLPDSVDWLPTHRPVGCGIEFRCASDGGASTVQDVLPPSIHPDTGKPYQWAGSGTWETLPVLPDAVLKLWLALAAPEASAARRTASVLEGAIRHPGRNDALTSLAGTMRRRGMSQVGIEAALLAENAARCEPPLDHAEVRKIAASIAKYLPASTLAPGQFALSPVNADGKPNDGGEDTTGRREYELLHVSELLEPSAPIDYLIERFGIEKGAVVGFVGPPESAKSLTALDLAARVAVDPIQPGFVVYLCGEGQRGIGRRLKALDLRHQLGLATAPLVVSRTAASLLDMGEVMRVSEAIEKARQKFDLPLALLVVDTLSRFIAPGEDNQSKDMGAYFAALDAIRGDAAVISVHHPGHADATRGRGSTAWKASLDAEFLFASTAEAVTITCAKMKDGNRPDPISFRIETAPTGFRDGVGNPINSVVLSPCDGIVVSRAPASGKNQKALLAELERRVEGGDLGVWTEPELRQIARDLGQHKNSARDAVLGLRTLGYLTPTLGGSRLTDPPEGPKDRKKAESSKSSRGPGPKIGTEAQVSLETVPSVLRSVPHQASGRNA